MRRPGIASLLATAVLALMAVGEPFAAQEGAAAGNGTAEVFSPAELEQLAMSFVLVHYTFKRFPDAAESGTPWDMVAGDRAFYEGFINDRKPMTQIGIFLEGGLVAVKELIVDERWLDKIEVTDFGGASSPARIESLLQERPGVLIAVDKPEALKAKATSFGEPDGKLHAVVMLERGVDHVLETQKVRPTTRLTPEGKAERFIRIPIEEETQPGSVFSLPRMWMTEMGAGPEGKTGPALLVNGSHQPVGVAFQGEIEVDASEQPRSLGNPVSEERLAYEELARRRESMKEKFGARIAEIRLTFRHRKEPSNPTEYMMMDMSEMMEMHAAGELPTELYLPGLPVAPDLVLVPRRIQREHARVVEGIMVRIGDHETTGSFVGAFRDFAAFLIRLSAPMPGADENLFASAGIAKREPVLTLDASRRLGGINLETSYSRIAERTRGYRNQIEWVPSAGQKPGMIFLSMDGRVAGVMLEQRREDEARERFREGSPSWRSSGAYGEMRRLYTAAELKKLLEDPEPLLDRMIMTVSKEEERRKLWLGVEFEPLTKELAEGLKIESSTKDGKVGLMVSLVYPGSPAEKIGLKQGDILLSLNKAGENDPLELVAQPDYFERDYNFGDQDIPRELQQIGYKMPRRKPWKSMSNLVTRILEVYGPGAEVELSYLAGGAERKTAKFVVEQAPHDFDSAPRHKDEASGLTVREVTFEVRRALNLPETTKCLVVSEVEEGSPAAVAQIEPFDLVMKVDEKEVADIAAFKHLMQEAQAARQQSGRVTMRFNLQYMGKARFADLTLQK